MSKGTAIYRVRLPAQLVAEVELTIARRNIWTKNEPWTLSDFIRVALREQMRKMDRSRRPRHHKKGEPHEEQGRAG